MAAGLLIGDCRQLLPTLPESSVQCCVTSPPYFGLRNYGVDGQLGLEETPAEYVEAMVGVFREVRRVLKPDGTLWLNLGDSFANDGKWGGRSGGIMAKGLHGKTGVGRTKRKTGLKPKDLIGIPWRVALALQADGWWLRCDIVWAKPSPMPEPTVDRPTRSHEFVFLLTKAPRYFYDAKAIAEPAVSDAPSGSKERKSRADYGGINGDAHQKFSVPWSDVGGTRNARDVWTIASRPYEGAHFAVMPPELAQRCILAGSRCGDLVLDPFIGSGTVGMVAESLDRRWLGIELNPSYSPLIADRTAQRGLVFSQSQSNPAAP